MILGENECKPTFKPLPAFRPSIPCIIETQRSKMSCSKQPFCLHNKTPKISAFTNIVAFKRNTQRSRTIYIVPQRMSVTRMPWDRFVRESLSPTASVKIRLRAYTNI